MQQKNYYDIVVETLLNAEKNNEKLFLTEKGEIFNNGERTLTPKEYEILGAIAYLYNVSFISQNGEMNKEAMTNFNMRIESCNVTKEELKNFHTLLMTLEVKPLFEANENQQKLITDLADINVSGFIGIFESLVKNSTFNIALSEDIDRMCNLTEINYSDLLKMQQTIYEELNLVGDSLELIPQLLSQPNVQEELNKASYYFDLQKFALISYDAVLSLREYFESQPTILETYVDVDTETLRPLVEIDAEILANTVQENVEEKVQDTVEIDTKDTDRFLHAYLKEVFPSQVTTELNCAEDVIKAFDVILQNDDQLPKAYQFMRANMETNRSVLSEIYGFDCTPIIDEYRTRYEEMRLEMKQNLERYHQDIEPSMLDIVANLVNHAIKSIVIEGAEKKSYLLQQLLENQIVTYKHLHQILGLIETCDVDGRNYTDYVVLVDFLNTNMKIKEVFDLVQDFDLKNMHINYTKAVLDFYSNAL